jgi:hypothetical protein
MNGARIPSGMSWNRNGCSGLHCVSRVATHNGATLVAQGTDAIMFHVAFPRDRQQALRHQYQHMSPQVSPSSNCW